MSTVITPFAMRCTQEQFDDVKEELVRRGVNTDGIMIGNWDKFPYLTNSYAGYKLQFGNTTKCEARTVYETFDKNILFECCGWGDKELLGYKRNPEFDITAEELGNLLYVGAHEEDGLFFWGDHIKSASNPHYAAFARATELGIIGEGKWLVPVYKTQEKKTRSFGSLRHLTYEQQKGGVG